MQGVPPPTVEPNPSPGAPPRKSNGAAGNKVFKKYVAPKQEDVLLKETSIFEKTIRVM